MIKSPRSTTLPSIQTHYDSVNFYDRERINLERFLKTNPLMHGMYWDFGDKTNPTIKISFDTEALKNEFMDKLNAYVVEKPYLAEHLGFFLDAAKASMSEITMQEQEVKTEKEAINPMIALAKIQQKGILKRERPPIPPPPVDYLVFQGGGAKGDTLFGCLSVLDQAGALKEAKTVFGSSVGALTALMVATGLSGNQVKDFCVEYFNPRNLLDARKSKLGAGAAGGILSIAKSVITKMGGFGQADTARHVIRNLLRQVTGNPNCTFAEFEAARKNNPALKNFVCTATWLPSMEEAKKMGLDENSAGITKIFSFQTSPDVVMADAILASMSLPAVWEPVTIRSKEGNEYKTIGTFTDGGVHNNLPIDIVNNFVSNKEYKSLPRMDKNGKIVSDNVCGFAFSMADKNQLNPAVCPVPTEVQEIVTEKTGKYEDNTREKEKELERYKVLSPSDLPKEEDTKQKVQRTKKGAPKRAELTRKASIHAQASHSGIKRLLNIVPASDVEDIIEKAYLHPDGSIILYNAKVGPGDLGISRAVRDVLIRIGEVTTRAFLKAKKDVTKEYKHPDYYQHENLDYLADDISQTNRLNELFTDLATEIEKYNQPDAESLGYSREKMQDNIKIQNLYWKINYLFKKLENKPTNDFDEFVSQRLSSATDELKKHTEAQKIQNDELFYKLVNVEGQSNELGTLINEPPFDRDLFETVYKSPGASKLIEIINDNPELLLSAAIANPDALDIMLKVTEQSYTAMHQGPKLAEKHLGKARMTQKDAEAGFKALANKTFNEKPLIFHAIDNNQAKSVTTLLQHHVSRNIQYQGQSIFQYAIDKGNVDCLIAACHAKTAEAGYRSTRKEIFLTKKAPNFGNFIKIGSEDNKNLAHNLFESKHAINILPILLKPENEKIWNEFAQVLNSADKKGITPLHLAAKNLPSDLFKSLRDNPTYKKYETDLDKRAGAPHRLQNIKAQEYMDRREKKESSGPKRK